MSQTVIHIDQLGKYYRFGYAVQTDSIREKIAESVVSAGRRLIGRTPKTNTTKKGFWALKDINLDIQQGDVIGIIGHNGAGKSTLLKILSRITDPSQGTVDIWGRIGSLLEVGTGFHPELTGRENIFLNGAILGMTIGEIKSHFDEIVAFSEIEDFIDTPVKRYSSGMYVRLAFAVAAHLKPEILIIDEVLAVGDAKFQSKCIEKMKSVATEGRTILFVSHNMAAVQSLCTRGIVLSHGQIIAQGSAEDAVKAYFTSMEERSDLNLSQRTDRRGKGDVRVTNLTVKHATTLQESYIEYGQPVRIELTLNRAKPGLTCMLEILTDNGGGCMKLVSHPASEMDTADSSENPTILCEIPELPLVPGTYHINVHLAVSRDVQDAIESAATFTVSAGQIEGRFISRVFGHSRVMPRHRWTLPG